MNEYTMSVLRDLSVPGAYLVISVNWGNALVVPSQRDRAVSDEVASILFGAGLIKSGPYTPDEQAVYITDAGRAAIAS